MSVPSLAQRVARWRVPAGFVCALLVLWFAHPTWRTLTLGGAVAALGELVRWWAAGHVEKSREVTRSGPYRFVRHPLYLGSAVVGTGVAIASASLLVAALVACYLAATLTAAIRAEEAHLHRLFGQEYARYAARTAEPMRRSFSLARAVGNREHHAVAGLGAGLALLALKAALSVR